MRKKPPSESGTEMHKVQVGLNDASYKELSEARKLGEHNNIAETVRRAIKIYLLLLRNSTDEGTIGIRVWRDGEKKCVDFVF